MVRRIRVILLHGRIFDHFHVERLALVHHDTGEIWLSDRVPEPERLQLVARAAYLLGRDSDAAPRRTDGGGG